MTQKYYFIAATTYEGCGHTHRTREAAAKCLRRVDATHGKKPRVYRIKRYKEVRIKTRFPSDRARDIETALRALLATRVGDELTATPAEINRAEKALKP